MKVKKIKIGVRTLKDSRDNFVRTAKPFREERRRKSKRVPILRTLRQ